MYKMAETFVSFAHQCSNRTDGFRSLTAKGSTNICWVNGRTILATQRQATTGLLTLKFLTELKRVFSTSSSKRLRWLKTEGGKLMDVNMKIQLLIKQWSKTIGHICYCSLQHILLHCSESEFFLCFCRYVYPHVMVTCNGHISIAM